MTKRRVKMQRETEQSIPREGAPAGTYTIDGVSHYAGATHLIAFTCLDCGAVHSIPLGDEHAPRVWKWDRNIDAPHVQPSIQILRHEKGSCNWHGYIDHGYLRDA
jgi:hypothetical protein